MVVVVVYSFSFYLGVDSVALCAEDTVEPRKAVPRGMMASMAISFVLSTITPFLVCITAPGINK